MPTKKTCKRKKNKIPTHASCSPDFTSSLFAENNVLGKKNKSKPTTGEDVQMRLLQPLSCVLCVIHQLVNSLFSLSPLGLAPSQDPCQQTAVPAALTSAITTCWITQLNRFAPRLTDYWLPTCWLTSSLPFRGADSCYCGTSHNPTHTHTSKWWC